MKVNNYIKVLSAVLIIFGYGSNNCEAQNKFERINVPIHRTNSMNYSTSNINLDDSDNTLIRSKSLKINNRKKNNSQLKRINALKKSTIQKISFNNQIDGLQTEIKKYIVQIDNYLNELFIMPTSCKSIPDKSKLSSLKNKIKGLWYKKDDPNIAIDISKLEQFNQEYNVLLLKYLNDFYGSFDNSDINCYEQSRKNLITFCIKYQRAYKQELLEENQINEGEYKDFQNLILNALTFFENCPEQLSNDVQIRMLIEQITLFQDSIYKETQGIKDYYDMRSNKKIQTILSECQENLASISKSLIQKLTKNGNIIMRRDNIGKLITEYEKCVSQTGKIIDEISQMNTGKTINAEKMWNEKLTNIINNYYYTIQ